MARRRNIGKFVGPRVKLARHLGVPNLRQDSRVHLAAFVHFRMACTAVPRVSSDAAIHAPWSHPGTEARQFGRPTPEQQILLIHLPVDQLCYAIYISTCCEYHRDMFLTLHRTERLPAFSRLFRRPRSARLGCGLGVETMVRGFVEGRAVGLSSSARFDQNASMSSGSAATLAAGRWRWPDSASLRSSIVSD
jgi:hypothetical protein